MLKNNNTYLVGQSGVDIESAITGIINNSKLNMHNNVFFQKALYLKEVDIISVYKIAYNWREITKTFLFTTISGLGCLAERIGKENQPNPKLISILQTGFSIISDDLSNIHPAFHLDAPKGANGVHYKWWEDTILKPVAKYITNKEIALSVGTEALLDKMNLFAKSFFGPAVQLRVVEAIALNICNAFFAIFKKVQYKGVGIFQSETDLAWIGSHMKVEEIHCEQVSNTTFGMTGIATTIEEIDELLTLTEDYADAWAAVLNDFSDFIDVDFNSTLKELPY